MLSNEEKDNVFKISVPIITNEELERIDYTIENDLDNIVHQISETVSRDRDIIILKKVIEKQSKEIEELKKPKYLLNTKTGEITTINNSEFISKDKIKAKIEELDKAYEDSKNELVENLQKDIESWKKYCDEQENDITLKNNKICDLEFKIEKQSKEIEELKTINQMQKYRIEVIDERELISKDIIKEILGIEENIDNEKLLSLLQTIVDENSRLEDIEDRKVQIEYNNVFNKGVKSVEDKIKAKIEEVKDGTFDAKIVLQSLLEKE